MKMLEFQNGYYSLTKKGLKIGISIKDKVKTSKLRTNPVENENKITHFLQKEGLSYRNKIARELKIDSCTVRDSLKRLIKKNRIKFITQDKFQRKFYKIKI